MKYWELRRLMKSRREGSRSTPPRKEGAPKLAVIVDHPAQHFSPALRLLDQDTRMDVQVFYWRADVSCVVDEGFDQFVSWDIDLLDGYTWIAPEHHDIRGMRYLGRALASYRPDVVLCFGWATPAVRLGLLWAFFARTPVFLYGDSSWQGQRRMWLRLIRGLLLRVLFKSVTGALSTGTFNREFYIHHGMHPSRIARGVYPADVDYYRIHADGQSARDQHGVPKDRFIIGYAGKLISRKGVDELLQAVAHLPRQQPWELIIVGGGPERGRLEYLVDELALTGRVRFLGFQNQSTMPALLRMCDVVVVPSVRDMRVLVCVEAMAAGAPVIVSSGTAVWGRGDLIDHGRTGLVYRSGNPRELAAHLQKLMTDQSMIEGLREAGSVAAFQHGPEAFRDAVISAFGRTTAD